VAAGVPFLSFESSDFPPGERRARWQALVGAYDVVLPDGCGEADFSVSSVAWLLGEVVVTRGRVSAVELRRTAERIAADGRDTFTFGLITRGHMVGEFDGRAGELRPGQIVVIDFSRPWRTQATACEFILVLAPRAMVTAAARHGGDLHGRLLDGATARILAEHFSALSRHLAQADASDAPVIQRTTMRMIVESLDALGPEEAAGREPERRVVHRVRRYVEDRLDCPDLSPAAICRALGLSRPTLYRAFRGAGGVASYILRRRLETVHVLLSDSSETRSLSELALAFGFASHAHFSTAFRRRFGYAPRDARVSGASSFAGQAALQFQAWMVELAKPRRAE